MELEFLGQFTRRMNHVGAYALLFKNSIPKQTWKVYGVESVDEQTNLLFSVLLYIMEQSLKDESCTLDDIGGFLDTINLRYYKRPLSLEQCRDLGDFIVNGILCDEGRAMYFNGFNYEEDRIEKLHISFVANKIIYLDHDVKRTSYYLTEEGYNLILGTLEIESSMQFTIHEMIFQLQLEKASYNKAAEEIKNVFNRLRIQLQGIQEAMRRIRQNALGYSVEEYQKVLHENISIIDITKAKFLEYRTYVKKLLKELEEQQIQVERLEEKEAENLKYLRIIESYLNRALDEYQKIFSTHFDLKALYSKELEALAQMSLIKRFGLRSDLYNPILRDASKLENLDVFLRPLFCNELEKIYQISKAVEFQKPFTERELEESEVMEDFDEKAFMEEQASKIQMKLKRYEDSLTTLLLTVLEQGKNGVMTLEELNHVLTNKERKRVFPSMEVFREIMVELLKSHTLNVEELVKEAEEHFYEEPKEFQLHHCILSIVNNVPQLSRLKSIGVRRTKQSSVVTFEHIPDEAGKERIIRCSNVLLQVKGGTAEYYGV